MLFYKYSGAGNDFIFIDNRAQTFSPHLVPFLCHRQEGIGADGVILLDSFENSCFKMRIFNSNGSLAEMCGNGIRCFTKFLIDLGFISDSYLIENVEGKQYRTSLKEKNLVLVEMAPILLPRFNQTCLVENQNISLHFINTGVPHVVFFVPEIEKIDVEKMGRTLRYHKDFQPHGVNVNFVMMDHDTLYLRTYERGVEHETLACGTGACAAAIAASEIFNSLPPLQVKVRSGAILWVNFRKDKEDFLDLTLEGPAKKVCEGSFFIP